MYNRYVTECCASEEEAFEAFETFPITLQLIAWLVPRLVPVLFLFACALTVLSTAAPGVPVLLCPVLKFHVHFSQFQILDNTAFSCTRPGTEKGSL